MKVKSITYLRTIHGSGGLESCPDEFIIKTNSGREVSRYIDTWYRPCDMVPECFYEAMDDVDNLDEAFEMYVDETKRVGAMPESYTKDRLMKDWKDFKTTHLNEG